MTIRLIQVQELPDFVRSTEFRSMEVLPISTQRALAQAKNPQAQPEDVALILIEEETELLAYLGLLPDRLSSTFGGHGFAWMSCIWVSPRARGKGLAKQLLTTAFDCWDDQLLATEFTAPARRLYDKTQKFTELTVSYGVRAYLRFNMASLLPKKNPRYLKIQPFLQLTDGVFNALHGVRLAWKSSGLPAACSLEVADKLDEMSRVFIRQIREQELIERGEEALDWLLEWPWLGGGELAKAEKERYHFSIYTQSFEYRVLKIFRAEELLACLIVSIREQALKIPYAFFESANVALVAEAIEHFMLEQKLSILTVYQADLSKHWTKKKGLFFTVRPFERAYLMTKKLATWIKDEAIVLQDGDGDCAFT